MKQFIKGFRKLHFVGPCITVFGSSRFEQGHPYYDLGISVGQTIADMGFTTMTGGGPGIMEAVNKGAKEAGGYSIGCNIKLPREQQPNQYMDDWVTMEDFFIRKFLLLKYSYAFFVLPGGWGTMDELFETLTLVQTGVLKNFPVVLMGKEYYAELWSQLLYMRKIGTISASNLNILLLTDDVQEARNHINNYISEHYEIRHIHKKYWWLAETSMRRSTPASGNSL
jgi:uncharacterized protein (TIGR00730 family)